MKISPFRMFLAGCLLAVGCFAAPPAQAQTTLYISGTMHIESDRYDDDGVDTWPDADALIDFFMRATAVNSDGIGMRWSVGADIGWLTGEHPLTVRRVIRETMAMGVQWDIHAHEDVDRDDCFFALADIMNTIGAGGMPTRVCSGLQEDEIDGLIVLAHRGRRSRPSPLAAPTLDVLWGIGHEDQSYGCWRPNGSSNWTTHDPFSPVIIVGGGGRTLSSITDFANEIGFVNHFFDDAGYPVTSATVNVRPSTLRVVAPGDGRNEPMDTTDGIDEIEAFITEMASRTDIQFATIAETATAWRAAGSIDSRSEFP